MNEKTTTDLNNFGYRELSIAAKLLKALVDQGYPEEFGDGIQIMFNPNSGYVFLTDEEYNVAMLNDEGKLEMWYSCPICGAEGFADEIKDIGKHSEDYKAECEEWLIDIGLILV